MINWIWGYIKRHPVLTIASCAVLAVPAYFILPIVGISALSVGIATVVWGGVSFLISGCLGCVAEQYSVNQLVVNAIKSNPNNVEIQEGLKYIKRHPEDVQGLTYSTDDPSYMARMVNGFYKLEEKGCLNFEIKKFLMNRPEIVDCISDCIIRLRDAGFTENEIRTYKYFLKVGDDATDDRFMVPIIECICDVLCTYKQTFSHVPGILRFSRSIQSFFQDVCMDRNPVPDIVAAIRGLTLLYHKTTISTGFVAEEMAEFLARKPGCQVIQGFYYFLDAAKSNDLLIKEFRECLRKNRTPGLFNEMGRALYDLYQLNNNVMRSDNKDLLKIIEVFRNIDDAYLFRIYDVSAKHDVVEEKSPYRNNPLLCQIMKNITAGNLADGQLKHTLLGGADSESLAENKRIQNEGVVGPDATYPEVGGPK